jgi:TfoX/Sxy family transcriptional regulator of competence genes
LPARRAAIEGLQVRRVFSGWGFYQRGLLFAAAWEGEFRFRTRQGHHWSILARLEAEPAAARPGERRAAAPHRRW